MARSGIVHQQLRIGGIACINCQYRWALLMVTACLTIFLLAPSHNWSSRMQVQVDRGMLSGGVQVVNNTLEPGDYAISVRVTGSSASEELSDLIKNIKTGSVHHVRTRYNDNTNQHRRFI